MKLRLFNGRLDNLLHQRNALFSLVLTLFMLNFLQAIATLFHRERVVVVPPETNREFWVEKNRVSAAYLEEMALFFANFILEVSSESAAYKREVILRNTETIGYGALKAKLIEDERRLKKEHVTTSFQPNSVKVSPESLRVEVTGDLLRFVGEKRISQSRDVYELRFVYRHSRLLITSFKLLRSDKE